jgi:predicted Zn-dependent peptidase
VGGSSTETASQKGAAQFLAAAAYAGNQKNSGLRIVRFLESLGASFSATADREKVLLVTISS